MNQKLPIGGTTGFFLRGLYFWRHRERLGGVLQSITWGVTSELGDYVAVELCFVPCWRLKWIR